MFIETGKGWVLAITGCMFSGKTKKLARVVEDLVRAKRKVKIFVPKTDNRKTRSLELELSKLGVPVPKTTHFKSDKPLQILRLADDNVDAVVFDEAQFIVNRKAIRDFVLVLGKLRKRRLLVVVAGLDTDYLHRPFGAMPYVLAVADDVMKRYARCVKCGEKATYTQRLDKKGRPVSKNSDLIVVGDKGTYEARCDKCFEVVD